MKSLQLFKIIYLSIFLSDYNILSEESEMRKRVNLIDRSSKENKYDQLTNLGIDVESHLNKSIILPKIYNRIAEIQANEFTRQKRAKEERQMSQLKGELEKLRRHIYLMDDRKMLERMKTDHQDEHHSSIQKLSPLEYSFHVGSTLAIRNSHQVANNLRIQRNTDKNSSKRQQNSNSFMDKSQITFTNSNIKFQDKQPESFVMDKKESSERSLKIRTNNKEAKGPNKKIRRKFRIMVYVVYFSLFLPTFAKKNYQNKLKLFITEYPHQTGKYTINKLKTEYFAKEEDKMQSKYKMDEARLWNFFQDKANILEMVEKAKLANCITDGGSIKNIKQHFQFLVNDNSSNSEQEFKQQLTFQEQLMFPKNVDYLVKGFQDILSKSIDNLTTFINKSQFFAQRWKTFSLGILNNSFVHNSHPKLPSKIIESGILRLHPFKEVLLVYNQQAEAFLLINDILCRIFAFKWMVRLQKLKDKPEYSEQVKLVTSFMITMLYLICEKMIDGILLSFRKENNDTATSVKLRNKFIRPIVPLIVKSDKKRDEKLLKTSRLITNAPLQEQANEVLTNNAAFVFNIQAKIKKAGYLLYEKIKEKMKEQFTTIKLQTLNERFFSKSNRVKKSNGEIEIRGSQEDFSASIEKLKTKN